MTSALRHSFRFVLIGALCLGAVPGTIAFSMVREYDADEFPSARQMRGNLRDLIDFEYADEDEDLKTGPAKRQQNQGGTCTCTCETRPANEEPKPRQQPPEAGALLRTGIGVKPASANRVIDRPQNPQTSSDVKSTKTEFTTGQGHEGTSDHHNHYHPKVAKGWGDYYGTLNHEPSKDEEQVEEAKWKEEERQKQKQKEVELKATVSSKVNEEPEFPWQRLPNTMCFRESCNMDEDCCRRYNLCDKSAKVCVDCWYGSICKTEKDCCQRFPHCKRPTKNPAGSRADGLLPNGKCVGKE